MPDVLPLINRIVSTWSDLALQAVVDAIEERPDADYYAAGFWLFYVDYTLFGVPCFALNTEENLAATDPTFRWNPPGWLVGAHPCYEVVQPLYSELSMLLEGQPHDAWDAAIDRHHEAMCGLCRRLTNDYHARQGSFGSIRKNPQFVFGIFEKRESEKVFDALLRGSIEPERRANLVGI